MILLIDNYDSFVHNLARYFQQLGQKTLVVRNDAITPSQARALRPTAIVLSPGPCTPQTAGCSMPTIAELSGEIPLLGVCLGHQAIAAAWGARIVRAPQPMHGRTSTVMHDESSQLLVGVPAAFVACRYHSLVVDELSLPDRLRITARTDDGVVMALEDQTELTFGVQFHPESVLTGVGYTILANFLRAAGCRVDRDIDRLADSERRSAPAVGCELPIAPVTF